MSEAITQAKDLIASLETRMAELEAQLAEKNAKLRDLRGPELEFHGLLVQRFVVVVVVV
jgi:hypothetical protein